MLEISDNGSSSTLTIFQANETDTGRYRCIENPESPDPGLRVDVIGDDFIITSPAVLKVKEPLVLQCNATNEYEVIQVLWIFEDKLINGSDGRHELDEGTLRIPNPRLSDAGEYTCKVEMRFGSTSKNFSEVISVKLAAHVNAFRARSINYVEGDTLNLVCDATGKPTPSIYWMKDKLPLSATDDRTKMLANRDGTPNAVLKITNLDKSDAGNYSCSAENEVSEGSELASAWITIRVKDKLAALWPFLGICLEVFILCLIILIYEKRRNKDYTDEDDTATGTTKKTVDGDGGDVRRRKQ
ncbi:unnamed protein product [Cyprideis torosa]|uniref:Uncharacterized protein n=1 Tax=Cyprideis torosa TaxID=163714 RepID=A0A7R8ZI34_9CRUS|nr:unnamed protein product [Cyprideis torosa]CAG0879184.1 unnamed protein product [Cyprideis torosa]